MKNKINKTINGYEVKVTKEVTFHVGTIQEVLEVLEEQNAKLEVFY